MCKAEDAGDRETGISLNMRFPGGLPGLFADLSLSPFLLLFLPLTKRKRARPRAPEISGDSRRVDKNFKGGLRQVVAAVVIGGGVLFGGSF